MSELYRQIFNGIAHGIFNSTRVLVYAIPDKIRGTFKINLTHYATSYQEKSDRDAIKSDFDKIGQDLFGALNKYEQQNKLKLTPRYRE